MPSCRRTVKHMKYYFIVHAGKDKTDTKNTSTFTPLKVPKCEIFDRSDFPDFYTIKSRPEGDFGVKIKKF